METSIASLEEIDNEYLAEVKKIRVVLSKLQIELPNHCDGFIVRCIRSQDGNSQRAVQLIQQFQVTIAEMTSWNVPLYPSAYYDLYKRGFAIPIKTIRTGSTPRVFLVCTRLWDPTELSFEQIIIAIWMLTQFIQVYFVDTQTNGFDVIWDFSHFSLQQAWAVNHFKLLKVFKWMQNKAAGRFKKLHGIFHPRIVGVLYNGVKPFLKEKIKKRIFLHGDNIESLHQHVDKANLPKFLGGPWPNEFNESDPYVDDVAVKGLFASATNEFFKDMTKVGFPSH